MNQDAKNIKTTYVQNQTSIHFHLNYAQYADRQFTDKLLKTE